MLFLANGQFIDETAFIELAHLIDTGTVKQESENVENKNAVNDEKHFAMPRTQPRVHANRSWRESCNKEIIVTPVSSRTSPTRGEEVDNEAARAAALFQMPPGYSKLSTRGMKIIRVGRRDRLVYASNLEIEKRLKKRVTSRSLYTVSSMVQ